MTTEKNPTYLKDSTGFCYTWTPLLAKESHLTPYDGAVDENGVATDGEPVKAKGKPPKVRAPEPAPVEDPVAPDPDLIVLPE